VAVQRCLDAAASGGAGPCYFLQKIPIEIRNKIYKLLLVSDAVSQPDSPNAKNGLTLSSKYGLTPSILCTCRQIYLEASEVMYGSNTFLLTGGTSTLTRHSQKFPELGMIDGFWDKIAAVQKVKHWKLFIGVARGHGNKMGLLDFCRAICINSPPCSIQVVVLHHFMPGFGAAPSAASHPSATSSDQHMAFLRELVQPFYLLRNVGKFELTGMALDPTSTEVIIPLGFQANVQEMSRELSLLVTGNSPISYVFKMHGRLVEYAAAFERKQSYKESLACQPDHDARISQLENLRADRIFVSSS